jgi:uncharacterized protein YyaL (SSP411 family)
MRADQSVPVSPDKAAAARSVPPGFAMASVLIAGLWLAHPPQAAAAPVSSADPAGVSFDGKTYTNRLIHSRDPYLLQHAHNPVNWYPWGPEALEAARRENKPIFVSFGYSTCYWCHVAEREIYSNPEMARLMNQWFINIKVDREERPDIDRIYMLATQILTGRGGWPNNVFLTPDLKPFYAGSYFPPEDRAGRPGFKRVLETMHRAWSDDRAKVLASADRVFQPLQQAARGMEAAGSPSSAPAPRQWLTTALAEAGGQFDDLDGGFSGGGATKFPHSPLLSLLLATGAPRASASVGARAPEAKVLRMATETLTAMAEGGLMDQLAGGFHRYSTEPSWSLPHFEKMLYDNAQLLSLYAHAYSITREPLFRQVALRTAHYLIAEMRAPEGGFYSAQDAEVNGIEGASYLWTRQQIETVLGKSDAARFMRLYKLTTMPDGFAGHPQAEGSVLRVDSRAAGTLADGKRQAAALEAMRPLREKLLAARAKRPQPARDEKIVTATNALAIIGFADAGRWLNDPALTRTALSAATWAWRHAFDPASGELVHQFFAGHPGNGGFLDDYALLGRAFLTLHRQSGDAVWLSRARQIAEAMLKRFDRGAGRLADSRNGTDLLVAPPAEGDSVLPSGQSSAIGLLLELSVATGDGRYAAVARRVLSSLAAQIASQPSAWGALLAQLSQPPLLAALESAPQAQLAQAGLPDSADHVRAQAHLATRKSGADLIVTIAVDAGYHINANPASDPSLIPTQLTLAGYPELKVDYPAPQRFKAPFAPQGIAVYHGRVTLLGHLPRTPAGRPSVANLRLQACNDEVCLAPATIEIAIEASPR